MIGFQRKDEKGIIGILSGVIAIRRPRPFFFIGARRTGFLMKSQGIADGTAVVSVSDLTAFSLNP